jgi:hypothetical protein
VAGDVTGEIEDDRAFFPWRWSKRTTDLLKMRR